jgi:ferredoxin
MTTTCFNATCINGNCSTCPRRIVDNRTTLDVKNESAAGMLDMIIWQFAGALVVVSIGLIDQK